MNGMGFNTWRFDPAYKNALIGFLPYMKVNGEWVIDNPVFIDWKS